MLSSSRALEMKTNDEIPKVGRIGANHCRGKPIISIAIRTSELCDSALTLSISSVYAVRSRLREELPKSEGAGLEMSELVTDQKTQGTDTATQRAGPSVPCRAKTEGRLLIQPHRAASFDGSGHFNDE